MLAAVAGLAQPPASGSAAAGVPTASTSLPIYTTRQNVFAIPFTVDRRVAQPLEVHLYVSTDQGTTWQLAARQAPTARQFTFRSRGDGEYWFASRTLDAGQPPSAQAPLRAELRVVVDTVPPQIEFVARPGSQGEVISSWAIADQNLLASSLKLEYQESAGAPWQPVATSRPNDEAVRTNYQGQLTWQPNTQSPVITVRAEVRDRAGNLAVVNRRLLLPAPELPSGAAGPQLAATTADPFARPGAASEGAVPWPSDNSMAPSVPVTGTPPAGPAWPAPTPPVAGPTGLAATPPDAAPAWPVSASSPAASETAPPDTSVVPPTPAGAHAPAAAAGPGSVAPIPPTTESTWPGTLASGPNPRATPTSASPAASAAPPPDTGAGLPPGERPRMTNATRFQLDYDVDAVGPAGVAEVQLWGTADGGQTWRLWGTDEDLISPVDVAVDAQGIFGFQVVVISRNGLAGRKPRSGDLADVWVGVDTQPPVARLTAVVCGEGVDAGKLVIRWEVSDDYLDPRPITLKFSDNGAEPWTVIASGLPNSGQFTWPADAQLPARVYLQLEARDEAGNVTVDVAAEPVQLDLLAPKARIRGIQPIQDLDREAFRQPRRG
jgi:hypothetical protein